MKLLEKKNIIILKNMFKNTFFDTKSNGSILFKKLTYSTALYYGERVFLAMPPNR